MDSTAQNFPTSKEIGDTAFQGLRFLFLKNGSCYKSF